MTYDEILYDVKESLNIISDDKSFEIPDSYILATYTTNRAFLITNTYNKSDRILDEDITQRTLVPMAPVDKGVCGIETKCKINRSVNPLPSRPITTHDGPMLTLSSPFIGAKSIRFITQSKAGNVGNSPFSSNTYYAFYSGDGHIYLISNNKKVLGIKTLLITGVFEDPQSVSNSSICESDCTRYPIKEAMHKQIMEMTIKDLVIKYKLPNDEINDATGQIKQALSTTPK